MRILLVLLIGLALGALGGVALVGGQEPEQRSRRIPQFENEHLRVWKTIIMPDQPLSMHRHENGRAIVALKGGTLHVVYEDGREKPMEWESGSAYWLDRDPPGELHGDVNKGDEPIEVIVVELQNQP